MNELVLTIIANGVLTPVLVFVTTWFKEATSKNIRQEKRDEAFVNGLEKRIVGLEKEVREVRVELKNRDAEYLTIYKDYTTLKAKYEVLEADHGKLKRDYDETVRELTTLKEDIKRKAALNAENLQEL